MITQLPSTLCAILFLLIFGSSCTAPEPIVIIDNAYLEFHPLEGEVNEHHSSKVFRFMDHFDFRLDIVYAENGRDVRIQKIEVSEISASSGTSTIEASVYADGNTAPTNQRLISVNLDYDSMTTHAVGSLQITVSREGVFPRPSSAVQEVELSTE